MMERPIGPGWTVALVLLAIGIAFLLLRPGSETVVVDDTPPVDPPADGSGVVASLRTEGGFEVLGLQIVSPTRVVEVRFITGPGCTDLLESGEPWPTSHPECAGPVDVSGTVGGLGRTPDGSSLIGVNVTVSRSCHSRLAVGMRWPPDAAECTG